MSSESDQQPIPPARVREPAPDPPEHRVPDAPGRTASASSEQPLAHLPAPAVTEVTADPGPEPRPGPRGDISPEQVREHLRRRAIFLRELAEARELRRRVTPHRSRRARIHAALRRRTFRVN
ncbi:hypothetical protein [Actinomadura macra]|uniref:hypothetical protein n=1 Tax=Actinomadura macra TaxID=46164 RepID=UPI0012F8CC4E|nr:hypothetical protein [Actinomadura macra]